MTTPHEPREALLVGQRLSEARHRRGISLGDAERQTRIARRFLEAMEADRFDLLPAPVYARGFLRNYARFLGLDANELVTALSPADPQQPSVLPVIPRRSNTGVWMIGGVAFGLGVLLWAFIGLGLFQSIEGLVDDIGVGGGGGGDPPGTTPIVATQAPSLSCGVLEQRETLNPEEQAWFAENCATPMPEPSTPVPDRASCDDIRGTDYRSQAERSFFLQNCLTPSAG